MATMKVQSNTVGEKTIRQPQNGAQATMNNNTHMEMTLDRSHSWSGMPAFPFPATISPYFPAKFTHLKDNLLGSKGVVVYNGRSAVGLNCSWVLAWHAPANNTPPFPPNRVYVLCGAKQSIDKLSYDQIQEALDTAFTIETFTDPTTRTSVDGSINDLVPNVATLIADFKVNP